MFDTLVRAIGGIQNIASDPIAIVEMLLIALSVNWCAGVLHGTRGTRPLRGVLTVLVVATLVVTVLAAQFDWPRLALVYQFFVIGLALVALVAFQPELRRAVIRAGDVRFLYRGTPQSKVVAALVQAARYLSRNRYGGLVAIQRVVDLSGWAEKGTILNADVSANTLNTIFFPNSPLHDLGVIIAGKRILAANCQFPMAESDEVSAAVGSRHLAAVGMSYESDALVLVVSEETGTISLADNGKLIRFISIDDLADELSTRLSGVTIKTTGDGKRHLTPSSYAWRIIRRLLLVVPLTLIIWLLANQATQTEIAGVKVQIGLRFNNPNRIVDVIDPQPAVFMVTFRGTTRVVEALRDQTRDRPLQVDWVLPDDYPSGRDRRSASELLEGLRTIQKLGVSVTDVSQRDLYFWVDELETVTMGLSTSTGHVQVVDQRFEPGQVQVTMRKRDRERLPRGQWIVKLPLEERLRGAHPGDTLTLEDVSVPERVGGFEVMSVEPKRINVSLRVIGQRVTLPLTQIPVRLLVSPEFLQGYRVEPVDPQEWLIEVQLEGDQPRMETLTSQDVQAYVTIPGDLLAQTTVLRRNVEFHVPEGIEVLSQRTVQLRLVPLEKRTP
ncbi:MAG: diadenylate cyclase [Planctomycetota bacterium]